MVISESLRYPDVLEALQVAEEVLGRTVIFLFTLPGGLGRDSGWGGGTH